MNTAHDLVYRQGTPNDLSQLAELTLLAYGQYKNVLSPAHWQDMETNLKKKDLLPGLMEHGQFFLCENETGIVGMAILVPGGKETPLFDAAWSHIRLVGVRPGYEGKGIGRKLTEMCVNYAEQIGENYVALHTSEFQDAARHIYESMGFKKHREFMVHDKKFWIYLQPTKNMKASITYHKAGPEDIALLVDNRILFALELGGEQSQEAKAKLRTQMTSYFARATADGTCISFIAKSEGKVAGIGSVSLREVAGNFRNPSGKWGYIMNMYTLPGFRRLGICSVILNLLMDAAKEEGTHFFELHATAEGETVYPKKGFVLHHEPTYRKFG